MCPPLIAPDQVSLVRSDKAQHEAPVIRLPRVRFTIRRMMIAVAVVAVGLSAWPFLVDLFSDDGPFHALNRMARTWDCGPASSVTVDVFEGSIRVSPSTDGRVTAEIMTVSVTSRSQWSADRALSTIDVTTSQRGNSIEIIARGASVPPSWRGYIINTAHVDLHVPDGVRLDLRVGKGQIDAGGVVNLDRSWRGYFGAGTIQSGTDGHAAWIAGVEWPAFLPVLTGNIGMTSAPPDPK